MRALVAALILLAVPAQARPVVVEMFTSQACSSCPPADALLSTLAQKPDILALSFNVTYWNGSAWRDIYALQAATDRQSWYASLMRQPDVYTPEAVVDGKTGLIGSNEGAVNNAIINAKAELSDDVGITIKGTTTLDVTLRKGQGAATIWLFGYDPTHTTIISGGENGGAKLTEINIVRSSTKLGMWSGKNQTLHVPRPAGERMAVILQGDNGSIRGAASD